MATWILTASPENHEATAAHGFRVIGFKERRQRQALPELVLDEPEWLAAESVKDELEHIRKWPAEHWKLAFQGQLRTVSEHDAALLRERMRARAGAPA